MSFFETLTRRLHRADTSIGRLDSTAEAHEAALSLHALDLAEIRANLGRLFSRATVASLSPPRIRFPDGEEAKPDISLVQPSTLALGDTLLALRYGDAVIVLGKVWVTP